MNQETVEANQESKTVNTEHYKAAKEGIIRLRENIKSVIIIDDFKLELLIASKIAGGHIILADSHGVGKTSLARALAGSINWEGAGHTMEGVELDPFSRIQCTVDLLPQDILGFYRYEMHSGNQFFSRGPIFAHFVLCDEINLLTPKTQGSFLQAMEERIVTVEGSSYQLPDPFFIIATMNLRGSHLFPLPAPQLDRFMVRMSLGYPNEKDEASIILKHGQENSWENFRPVVDASELQAWAKLCDEVTLHPDLAAYIVRILRKTRGYAGVLTGASPRAGIKLARLARAMALSRGMDYVTADIVKQASVPVLAHRLELSDPNASASDLVRTILAEVRV